MKVHMFFNATLSGMSGGDMRALRILAHLLQNSIECTIYAPSRFCDVIRHEGINPNKTIITSTKKSQTRNLILRYMIHTFKAVRHITRHNDLIVYCTSAYLPDIIPAIRLKHSNNKNKMIAPVFHLIEHYKTRPGNKLNNIIAYYEQRFSLSLLKHNADIVIVINPLVKKYLEQHGFSSERVKMVDCGVDEEHIEMSSAFQETQRCYDAVYMGRLAPSKGVFDLAAIWSNVVKKIPQARLAVIGKGTPEIEKHLVESITELNLSQNIHLLGFLESKEAFSYMKSAKLFVFPSYEEGWGISIADAMACGLAVVTYDLPVYQCIFKNTYCEAPRGDTNQIAEKITRLLSDDELRADLGEKGKNLVLHDYVWGQVAKKEIEILKKMENMDKLNRKNDFSSLC